MKSSRKELKDKDVGFSIEEWNELIRSNAITLSLNIPFQIASPKFVIRFENQEVFNEFMDELVNIIRKYSEEIKIERRKEKEENLDLFYEYWLGDNIRVRYYPSTPRELFVDIMKLIDKYFNKIKIINIRVER